MYVNPEALQEAAQRLEAMAHRLSADLARCAPALSPMPAGLDEVSVAAARWSTSASSSLNHRTHAAVAELRAASGALAAIAAGYSTNDETFSAALHARS
nr:PE family protein [Hoyosella altamirensis]